jgi:uncharacterized Zn finger protein (UPF0148 family)
MKKKFSCEEVVKIRKEAKRSRKGINALATKYGVPYYTIYQLVKGTSYKKCGGPLLSRKRTKEGDFIPDPEKRKEYILEKKKEFDEKRKKRIEEKRTAIKNEIIKRKKEKSELTNIKEVSKNLRIKIISYSEKGATVEQLARATRLSENLIKKILKKKG